jgi:hypothetical protein
VVVECKTKKLSFVAQFGDDPVADAQAAYDEIAKGVFQLWRFFSHVRRGLFIAEKVRPDVHALVLTLDPWLVMAADLREKVIETATNIAKQKDPGIIAEDRRKVVFCSIEELESMLARGDEDSFLSALSAAREDQFKGWALPAVQRQVQKEQGEPRKFPFDLGEVLPWWRKTDALERKQMGLTGSTNDPSA